jgi:hypothetical protein
MNCPESRDLLQKRLDRATVSDVHTPELEQHLVGCRSCLELHMAASRLIEGLALLSRPEPVSDLSERIHHRVLQVRRQSRRRLAVAAALAASMLLAFMLYSRRTNLVEAPGPATERADSTVPRRSAPLPLNENALEVGHAVASLAQRTADEAVDPSRLLLPFISQSDMTQPQTVAKADSREATSAQNEPANTLQEFTLGVSQGLEPVTKSARRALDLFLREVASVDPQRRTG